MSRTRTRWAFSTPLTTCREFLIFKAASSENSAPSRITAMLGIALFWKKAEWKSLIFLSMRSASRVDIHSGTP